MFQKRKRKIRQGDSPRTLNIHLLDQLWASVGESRVQADLRGSQAASRRSPPAPETRSSSASSKRPS